MKLLLVDLGLDMEGLSGYLIYTDAAGLSALASCFAFVGSVPTTLASGVGPATVYTTGSTESTADALYIYNANLLPGSRSGKTSAYFDMRK